MARTEGVWLRDEGLISPSDDVPILLLNSYINFGGLLVGSDGYGIRDNNGVIEYKTEGGGWSPVGSGSGSISNTFETLVNNLNTYPFVINRTSGKISSIVYTVPAGEITQTITRTSGKISSRVLSGDLPVGLLETTQTITRTGNKISSVSYS